MDFFESSYFIASVSSHKVNSNHIFIVNEVYKIVTVSSVAKLVNEATRDTSIENLPCQFGYLTLRDEKRNNNNLHVVTIYIENVVTMVRFFYNLCIL